MSLMRKSESVKRSKKVRGSPQDRCFGLLDVDENTAAELMAQCPIAFRELGK